MDRENRPKAREKHVTGEGSGVHRRGSGTGQGPVGGSGSNPFQRRQENSSGSSMNSSGNRTGGGNRGGGRSPLGIILLLAVVLLGGGGGLSGLFGGGSEDTGSQVSGTNSSYSSSYNTSNSSTSGGSYGSSTNNSYSSSNTNNSSNNSYSNTNNSTGSNSYSSTGNSSTSNSSTLNNSTSNNSTSNSTTSSTNTSSYVTHHTGSNNGVLNRSVSEKAREKYTTIKGNGNDTITILVYMCGTDLESRSGMATSDLSEMAKANLSDKINLIVYTGGCKSWKNNIISSSVNQIYQLKSGGLACLNQNAGSVSMTKPDTLSDFITWGCKNFPADRYDLIFWDHGGGSLSGYGYDEKYSSSGSMSLASINSALKTAGQKFDFIGFDACLMATVENARMLADYADYLIASEETEPGIGWYYTNWLNQLSANTSLPTLDIGKQIVDDFVSTCARQTRGQSATLSVVDLAELSQTLPAEMSGFSQDLLEKIRNQEYQTVAAARNNAREFAQSSVIDQIDFVDFAQKMKTEEGAALSDVLQDAVKYNLTSSNITNAYGLSVYFPYKKMSSVNTAVQTYDALDMDEDFADCIREFASMELGGQVSSGSSGSPLDVLLGGLFGNYGSSSSYGSYGSSSYGGSSYGSYGNSSYGGSSYGGSSYGGSSYGNNSYGNSSYGGSSYGGYGNSSYGSSSYGSGSYGNSSYGSGSMSSGDIADILSALLGGDISTGISSGSYGSSSYGSSSYGSSSYGSNSYGSSSYGSYGSAGSLLSGLSSLAGLDSSFFGGRSFDVDAAAQYLEDNHFDYDALYWVENTDGDPVISLSDEQWDLIQSVDRNLFYDDGEGFVDLGLDNTFGFDDDGNLVADTEKTGIHIDGQPVAYYHLETLEDEDGNDITTGYVPALLNGQKVNLILSFDSEHPSGTVLGAQPDYDADVTETIAKGLIELEDGDQIDFLCDYYSYDGEFQDSYLLGDTLTVTGDPEVSDKYLGDQSTLILYRFTDMYQQHYWTEVLE